MGGGGALGLWRSLESWFGTEQKPVLAGQRSVLWGGGGEEEGGAATKRTHAAQALSAQSRWVERKGSHPTSSDVRGSMGVGWSGVGPALPHTHIQTHITKL
jgi:hypothetical protein